MTAAQYLTALKRLGLSPYGKDTAQALGVSIRQLGYYAAGTTPIPPMLERLLALLLANVRR